MKQGWEIKKLGEIATYINGYAFKPEHWGEDGLPIIRIQNLNNPNAEFNYCSLDVPDKYVIDNGDILISWSASLGVYEWNQGKAYLNQHIFKVLFNKIDINKFFFKYAIGAKIKDMIKNAHGATMKHIVKGDFDNTPIPVPPLPIQEQIVSELDLLSGIIEKKREQLKELDALAQSIFYDMFGDPITNEKGWEVKKLGEVCDDITDGDHMPPPKSETGIPFLTISDIDKEKRELNFNDTFFVPQEYYDNLKENRRAKKGDVLYTVTGSYGIPVIVNTCKHFCFQRHIALLKPKQENLLSLFLCQWFLCEGVKFMADQVATGIAQKTVSLTSIRKFEIILPPLPLQHQFATKIEAIEKQKELIKQSISETETLFNERMQEHFG